MAKPNFLNKIFINNKFLPIKLTYPLINPNNECGKHELKNLLMNVHQLEIVNVAKGTKEDVDEAVRSARSAFEDGSWRNYSGRDRRNLLLKIANDIEKNQVEYAELESLNVGKPIIDAIADVSDAVEVFRYFAGYADKIYGSTFGNLHHSTLRASTVKNPVGVVGMIVAFNYPLLLCAWKLAPALACRNTVVCKPSDLTPLTTLRLAQTFLDCEAPSGIFNVVPGLSEVGEAISDHPDIDKISFTGSPEIGKKVLEASSKSNLKRVTLELGGKSPIIVFDDANLHRAVEPVFGAFCSNMGQNCVAGSRLYLHEKIYDEFLNLLKERISQVKIGESSDKSKNFGPLVSKSQFEKVKSFFSHAEKNKINCLTGGRTHERLEKGFFVEPTVYFNVKEDDLLATKEVFGPILSVLKPFNNFDEVIQRANDTSYGLGAAIFTNDIKKADRFVNEIRAGTIWVNTYNICDPYLPFGGIKGMSGFGKDMGKSCLDEYTVEKSVMYDMN